MNSFSEHVGAQFGNPRGIAGRICCYIMNTMNRRMYDATVSLLELTRNDSVLDVGYGNGKLLRDIYERTGACLYGIDISEDMKVLAEKKNRRAKKEGKLFLSTGDCCDLPYDDGRFDAVTSINTVYFWDDVVCGLSDIRRTLKDGGSFFNTACTKEFLNKLSPYTNNYKKYDPGQFIEFGEQAGFKDVYIKDIVKGKSYIVIFTK